MSPDELIAKWRQQAKKPKGYGGWCSHELCACNYDSRLIREIAPSAVEAKEPQ